MNTSKRTRNLIVVSNILLLILLLPNELTIVHSDILPYTFIRVTYYTSYAIMMLTQLYVAKGIWGLTKNRPLIISFLMLSALLTVIEILNVLHYGLTALVVGGIIAGTLKIYLLMQIHKLKSYAIKPELLLFGWTLIGLTFIVIIVIPLAALAGVDLLYTRYIRLSYLLYPVTLFILALKVNQEHAKVTDILTAINNYPHM